MSRIEGSKVSAPFTVHHVAGYGRTAWQVRDANNYIVGRLVSKANADEIARLLNLASETEGAHA